MRRAAVVMLMLVALCRPASGQESPDRPPPSPSPQKPDTPQLPLNPTVAMPSSVVDLVPGDKAPDFQLDSSLGGVVRSADLKGHWSVLVFDQSRARLTALSAVQDSIWAMGVQAYGVCREGTGSLRALAQREKIGFPLLSDVTGQISQLFSMYDNDQQAIQSGIVIVDPLGVVRMVIQGPSLHPDDVFTMVKHVVRGA